MKGVDADRLALVLLSELRASEGDFEGWSGGGDESL